jgi:hypothetical protein
MDINEKLELFVSCFIINEKKERLLYEIKQPQKRRDFFDRFTHETQNILKKNFIVMQGKDIESGEIIKKIYENEKTFDEFILIVDYEVYESNNIKDLLEKAYNNWGQSILLCDHFAFIKEEVDYGAPQKILLNHPKFLI